MGTKSNKARINRKQMQAAEMLANPEFTGTITLLCQTVGVVRSTFYEWMDDERFREYVDKLIDKYTDSELSRVWKALMRRIDAGDIQAIKLYFELKGKYKTAPKPVHTAAENQCDSLIGILTKTAVDVFCGEYTDDNNTE